MAGIELERDDFHSLDKIGKSKVHVSRFVVATCEVKAGSARQMLRRSPPRHAAAGYYSRSLFVLPDPDKQDAVKFTQSLLICSTIYEAFHE